MASVEPEVPPLHWLRLHSESGSVRSGAVEQVPALNTQVLAPLTRVQVEPLGQSASETQVPQLKAWLQVRQVPVQLVSQQTPSTQSRWPVRGLGPHSRLMVHGTPAPRPLQYLKPTVSPDGAVHELFLHWVPTVQFTTHALELQAPPTHSWPAPQSDAAAQAFVHLLLTQVKPVPQGAPASQYFVHLPATQASNRTAHLPFTHRPLVQPAGPLQLVAVSVTQSAEVVQEEAGSVEVGPVHLLPKFVSPHSNSGSMLTAAGVQSPSFPAWLQDRQSPLHAPSQHTPSTQKPEPHSAAVPHESPSPFVPPCTHWPPTQLLPDLQSEEVAQLVRHAPAPLQA